MVHNRNAESATSLNHSGQATAPARLPLPHEEPTRCGRDGVSAATDIIGSAPWSRLGNRGELDRVEEESRGGHRSSSISGHRHSSAIAHVDRLRSGISVVRLVHDAGDRVLVRLGDPAKGIRRSTFLPRAPAACRITGLSGWGWRCGAACFLPLTELWLRTVLMEVTDAYEACVQTGGVRPALSPL